MFPCKVHYLRYFGFCDFICKNATLSDPVMMNMQHDLRRCFNVLLKEFLKNVNDEFHRRVVVVENQNPIEIRFLRLWLDFCNDRCAGTAASTAIVLAHSRDDIGNLRVRPPIERGKSWI